MKRTEEYAKSTILGKYIRSVYVCVCVCVSVIFDWRNYRGILYLIFFLPFCVFQVLCIEHTQPFINGGGGILFNNPYLLPSPKFFYPLLYQNP